MEKDRCSKDSSCLWLEKKEQCIQKPYIDIYRDRESKDENWYKNWYKKYNIPNFTKTLTRRDNILQILSEIPRNNDILSKNVEPWWKNKPAGYYTIFGHGSYESMYSYEQKEFVVPDGIRIIFIEESGKTVNWSIDWLLKHRLFLEESCVQSKYGRTVVPAYLFSYQSGDIARINYNICNICKNALNDCKICKLLALHKNNESNCTFSIYNSGAICSNLSINWDTILGSETQNMLFLSKIGIYKLPNFELSSIPNWTKLPSAKTYSELEIKYPDWSRNVAFEGSFMPSNIPRFHTQFRLEEKKGEDLMKAQEENRIHQLRTEEIKSKDPNGPIDHGKILVDPKEIWDKYGLRNSSLHHIIYNVPRGTKEHPMVYFINVCRVASETRIDNLRQMSDSYSKPLVHRNLSEIE